jgi:SAM-dependent methyltransferase
MSVDDRERMLTNNVEQAAFYEADADSRIKNLPMAMWRFVRRRLYYVMDHSKIRSDQDRLHKEWLGDLAGKKVLDFGCYEGNRLSHYLAENSREYLGVDLSASALERLDESFRAKGIEGARVRAVDILSSEFDDTGFDVIYAQGVLHHFNPIDVMLSVLSDKLNDGGIIVSFDPLQTSVLTRSVRTIYHPFRVDREWEWPFRRETFDAIQKKFEIEEIQGFIGASKWAVPMAFVSPSRAASLADRWHDLDLSRANGLNEAMYSCLQVAMKLRKRASR